MAKLLPDRLRVARNPSQDKPKPEQRVISIILEWLQCSSRYIVVIARKQLQRIPDLMAYQTLIIESQMQYQGEAWMGYNHQFCQRAAINPHISWSAIDTTLWNLMFAGKAKNNPLQPLL